MHCSLEECERRDPKGMYVKARCGEIPNYTGISAPYEVPQNPDIRVLTEKKGGGSDRADIDSIKCEKLDITRRTVCCRRSPLAGSRTLSTLQ